MAVSGAGAVGGLGVGLGVILLIGAVMNVVFGFGAWNLHGWAWWLGLIGNALPILSAIGLVVGGWQSLGAAIGSTIVNIFIVVYLLTPGVQRAFGRS
jgi:hypothetical protein